MSKVKSILNEQFYTALGITPYLLRPEFNLPIFEHLEKEAVGEAPVGIQVSKSIVSQPLMELSNISSSSTLAQSVVCSDAISSADMTENVKISSSAVEVNIVQQGSHGSLASQPEALTSDLATEPLAESTLPTVHWVVLGEGLSDVWQSDMSRQWRLWQNILRVWDVPISFTQFIDTQGMMDENRLEALFESVLEIGGEVILAFESSQSHPLVEMLSEGMEVILIPSLMDMLESGHAKQRFYQTMVEANQNLPSLLPRSF